MALSKMSTSLSEQELAKKKGELNKRINLLRCVSVIFLLLGVIGLAVAIGLFYATKISTHEVRKIRKMVDRQILFGAGGIGDYTLKFQAYSLYTWYGIVLDAGSSHTTLYIYHWESDKVNGTGRVEEISECEAEALSDFDSHPDDAGPSLASCLDRAQDLIPWAIRHYSPIYLGATAGLRIIRSKSALLRFGISSMEDPDLSDRLLKSVRDEILSTPFQVTDPERQVQIISGRDEGIGLWVTANYVSGSLGNILSPKWMDMLPNGASKTLGVMDLGGASTQLAFALDSAHELPSNISQQVTLFNENLHLFSDSFLCYGMNEMRRRVFALLAKDAGYHGNVTHPCFADGSVNIYSYEKIFASLCTKPYRAPSPMNTSVTFLGTGNNLECSKLVGQLFDQSECSYPQCSFDGRMLPSLPDRFLARGGLAYTVNDLDALDDNKHTNYSRFVSKLKEFCEKPHSEVSIMNLYNPNVVCLNGHYIHHLLSNIYHIHNETWSNILFSNKIGDISMGWSLGYMTNITSTLPKVPRLKLFYIDEWVFILVAVIACICIIVGVISCVLSVHFKRRRYALLSNQNHLEPF